MPPVDSTLRIDPVDLTLHIGTGKTGTSTMQNILRLNEQHLVARGTLYPSSPGEFRHVRLGLYLRPDDALTNTLEGRRQGETDPVKFRHHFEDALFREVREAGAPRVVLSDESLYGARNEALKRTRAFTEWFAYHLRLVVYLRRQDDHVSSRYQELVKTGETRRLVDRLEQMDLSRTYDYHSRLVAWRDTVQPAEFVVRRFEPGHFLGGSLHHDFLHAAGIDVDPEDLELAGTRNESLDAESLEFLRILNLLRVEQGATAGLIAHRRVARKLASTSHGPTLTLPTAVLDKFMSRWERGNRAVALEFLDDKSGQLFRSHRKTNHTTTEQHFDPARTDHYSELLDLPRSTRLLLQQVAEREARAR